MCKLDGYFSVNGTDITFYSNFDGKPTREWVMHEAGIVGHQCKLLGVFFEYCLICVHGKEIGRNRENFFFHPYAEQELCVERCLYFNIIRLKC